MIFVIATALALTVTMGYAAFLHVSIKRLSRANIILGDAVMTLAAGSDAIVSVLEQFASIADENTEVHKNCLMSLAGVIDQMNGHPPEPVKEVRSGGKLLAFPSRKEGDA